MKSVISILIAAFSFLFSTQLIAQDVSERTVREFLNRFDKAIATKNSQEISSYTSENADFSVTVPVGTKTQTMRLGKAQYIAMLADVWAQASNYSYRRTNERIAVSGGTATVTADVFESMTVQGKRIATKAKEIATIERINGVLLLTKVVAHGSM